MKRNSIIVNTVLMASMSINAGYALNPDQLQPDQSVSRISNAFTSNENDYVLIHVSESGTLSSLLKEAGGNSLKSIKITGTINANDINSLKTVNLENIDMGDATSTYSTFSLYDTNENTSLKTIVLPKGITTIGSQCFYNFRSLYSVDLPQDIININTGSFNGCTSLITINLPKSITSIGSNCFYNCSSLSTITLPEGLSELKSNCFYGCVSLKTINLPKNLTSIDYNCFYGCTSLKTIDLPESLISLGFGCFYGCTSLMSINLPKNLTSIGYKCFYECKSLRTIDLPESLLSIGYNCFSYCTSLKTINIPESITSLASSLFYGCKLLESINLPETITSIDSNCFSECGALKTINIPKRLTSLGSNCFYNCISLNTIDLPESLTSIGANCFTYTNINSLTPLPSKIENIGINIFGMSRYLILNSVTPPLISGNAYYEYISVPKGCKTAYKNSGYYDNTTIIEEEGIIADLEITQPGTLGEQLLDIPGVEYLRDINVLKVKGNLNQNDLDLISKSMSGLISIDISKTDITTFVSNQFKDNKVIKIHLPEQLTNIPYNSFYNCINLKEITIPEKVRNIEARAFNNCNNLISVIFSGSINTIANEVFYNCRSLSNIEFLGELKAIQSYTFNYCYNLQSLKLPESLESIGNYVFRSCNNLKEVNLPNMLKSIGTEAFIDTKLEKISIPSTITHMGENAFSLKTLKTIECNIPMPLSLTADPFTNIDRSNAELIVPRWSIKSYKLADYWGSFGSIKEMDKYKLDYLPINGKLILEESTAPEGTPIIDLFSSGELKVESGVAIIADQFNIYNDFSNNTGTLINESNNFNAAKVEMINPLKAKSWYFFTPPFDLTLDQFSLLLDNQYVIRYYDGDERATNGTGKSWKDVPQNELIKSGKGYIIQISLADSLILSPSIANGKKIFENSAKITLNEYNSAIAANRNWNFIGNPFTCFYDINKLSFDSPITIWDAKNNTYQALSPKDDDYFLSPYQTFFVQKPDGVNSIEFKKDGKKLYSETLNVVKYAKAFDLTSSERQLINLSLSDGQHKDQCRIVINSQASRLYEMNCDASKFMSVEAGISQIYSIDDTFYSINERPNDGSDISLGILLGKTGQFTISANGNIEDVLLIDKKLGNVVALSSQDYVFESLEGTDNDSFSFRINK